MAYSRRNYNDATFIFPLLPGYGIFFEYENYFLSLRENLIYLKSCLQLSS